METTTSFADYLRAELDKRGLTIADVARMTGVSHPVISRWLGGQVPSVENSRLLANAFGRPLLEVLVAAGHLWPDEVQHRVESPILADRTDEELLYEVRRRMADHAAPTQDDVDADPERYVEVPKKGQKSRKRR